MYLSTVGWYSVTQMIIVVDFGSSLRPSHAKLGTLSARMHTNRDPLRYVWHKPTDGI